MKFNADFRQQLATFSEYVVIVEGKKDVSSLHAAGFKRVYAIHQTGVPIREKVLEIAATLTKKDRVCILTDFDRKGKQLYELLKQLFQEQGARLDSTLRGIILKAGISHAEGLSTFLEKAGLAQN